VTRSRSVEVFLAGARVVVDALADPAVAAAWDRPSVLEGQAVGSLAGHLARGGVWVVGDYLDQPPPAGPPDFTTAAAYFAHHVADLSALDHTAIRDRGAAVATAGPGEVVATARERLAALDQRLPAEPAGRLVRGAGRVMPLDAYLDTRIVEQTVHLDDLARSAGAGPWVLPDASTALTVAVGAEIGRLRHGGVAMVHTLYRTAAAGVLPVL
jgi:Mycothiol maleylpyruvate isomerase N-terminal domain